MELIDRIKQINWKQTKFMLPAILYIPLMGGSYFIFDLFHMEKTELPDKTLQTTEFLNPELPDAQIKNGDGIGNKYENMAKSWGKIQDYSAVDNIERKEPEKTSKRMNHSTQTMTLPCLTNRSRTRLWPKKKPIPKKERKKPLQNWKNPCGSAA